MKRLAAALLLSFALAATLVAAQAPSSKPLDIYVVDTEGGKAALFVSPTGQTLLIDSGNPGGRDTDRIMEVVNQAGLKQIDYPDQHALSRRSRRRHHGAVEAHPGRHVHRSRPFGRANGAGAGVPGGLYGALWKGEAHGRQAGRQSADHRPRLADRDVGRQSVEDAAAGGGKPNPDVREVHARRKSATRPTTGSRSAASSHFGQFRLIDLGDLLWNKEQELMCPNNPIGTVDLVHGLAPRARSVRFAGSSCTRSQPRVGRHAERHAQGRRHAGDADHADVAGARGHLAAALVVRSRHRAEQRRRVHRQRGGQRHDRRHPDVTGRGRAVPVGRGGPAPAAGSPERRRRRGATPQAQAPQQGAGRGNAPAAHSPAYYIKISARPDGSFTVTNSRNGFSKTYAARPRAR